MTRSSDDMSARELRLNEVIAHYLEMADAGQPLESAAWLAEHPDLAEDLAAFLRDRQIFARVGAPLAPAAAPRSVPLGEMPTMAPGTTPELASGMTLRYFGDYELLAEVARGGMGVVWKARQVSVDRLVALKLILAGNLASADDIQRFQNEAIAGGRLDHPHIVPIYEVGETNGLHYFTMKFIEGQSLSARFASEPARERNTRAFVTLMAVVARAVHHAHQHGILHRDLKPANILLDTDGDPHVTDFGLAKRLEGPNAEGRGALTQTGAILGTPAYMAPEQARGEKRLSLAADVYALGAILYEGFTGRTPFQGHSSLDLILQVLDQEPPRPRSLTPRLDPDLETITLKCLEKDPTRRYSSALALAEDLERWMAHEPIAARPTGPGERLVKWARRRPALAALGAVALLAVASQLVGQMLANHWLALKKQETEKALEEKVQALSREEQTAAALEKSLTETRHILAREEHASYISRIALAHNEWQNNHVARAAQLLEECPIPLRQWEWRYLKHLCQGERLTLSGHSEAVTGLAFSPDGGLLATAGSEGTVKLWDTATGALRYTFTRHSEPPSCVVFHPTESCVISATQRPFSPWAVFASALSGKEYSAKTPPSEIFSWDPKTGKILRRLPVPSGVLALAMTPDGRNLAACCADEHLRVWDWETEEELFVLSMSGLGTGLSYRSDGRELAVVVAAKDQQAEVRLLDSLTGTKRHSFPTGTLAFTSLTYSRQGSLLAGSSADRVVVWDVGTLNVRFQQHLATGLTSQSVALSPNARTLAVACFGQKIRLWDLETGLEKAPLRGYVDWVTGVAFSPDGKHLAATTGHPLVGSIRSAFGQGRAGEVKMWDATTDPDVRNIIGHSGAVRALAVSPDGRHLASGSEDKTIRVWDMTTWQTISTIKGEHIPESLCFSQDGEHLYSAAEETHGWAWREGKGIQKLATASTEVVLLPGSSSIVTAGEGNRVKLWDTSTGKSLLTLLGPLTSGGVRIAAQPDGRLLALAYGGWTMTGGSDGTIHIPGAVRYVDPKTGQIRATLSDIQGKIKAVAWSPQGRICAVADGADIRLYDGAGAARGVLRGQAGEIQGLAFSPDEARLVATSDQALKIWDLESGRETLTLPGPARAPVFSKSGHWLMAATGNDIRVWDAHPLPEAARTEPGRPAPEAPDLPAPGDPRPKIVQQRMDQGVEALTQNDPAQAFLWFVAALQETPPNTEEEKTNRIRLGWILQQLPKLGAKVEIPLLSPVLMKPVEGLSNTVLSPHGDRMAMWLYNVSATPQEQDEATKLGRELYNVNALQVYDTHNGKPVGPLLRTKEQFFEDGFAFTSDGKHLAILTVIREERPYLRRLRLLHVEKGENVSKVIDFHDHSERMLALEVSPDGRYFLLHQGPHDTAHTVRVWETATGQPLALDSDYNMIHFSPDGRRFLSTWNQAGAARWNTMTAVWDAQTRQRISPPLPCAYPHKVSFNRDGAIVALGVGSTVQTYRVADGQLLGPAISVGSNAFHLALHPEGHTIAVARDSQWRARTLEEHEVTLQLWDVASGKARTPRRVLARNCSHLNFSPDGRLLFTSCTASWQADIRGWDATTCTPLSLPTQGYARTYELPSFHDAKKPLLLTLTPHEGSQSSDDKAERTRLRMWDLRPTSLSIQHLERLAWLHSGKRLRREGEEDLEKKLSENEYREVWREAKTTHPEWFGPEAPEIPSELPNRAKVFRPQAAPRTPTADYRAVAQRHEAALTPTLSALIEALAEPNADVRLAGLDELRQLETSSEIAIDLWIEALGDSDAQVRATAAESLGRRGPEAQRAVPALQNRLRDWHSDTVDSASWALGRIGPAARPAFADLLQVLACDDHRLRGEAARALSRIDPCDPSAVPGLAAHLAEYGDTRRHILRGLVQIGQEAPEQVVSALLPWITEPKKASWSRDYRQRNAAAAVLTQLGPKARTALPALQTALAQQRQRPQQRVALAEALWKVGGEADPAVLVLRRVLQDGQDDSHDNNSPAALVWAANVLGSMGPQAKNAIPELEKLLAQKDEGRRLAAAMALATIDGRSAQAVPVLTSLAAESGGVVQVQAILALGRLGSLANSAIPILRKAALEEEKNYTLPGVRITTPAPRDSDDRREDPRTQIRRAVAEAIRAIEGRKTP